MSLVDNWNLFRGFTVKRKDLIAVVAPGQVYDVPCDKLARTLGNQLHAVQAASDGLQKQIERLVAISTWSDTKRIRDGETGPTLDMILAEIATTVGVNIANLNAPASEFKV